MSKTIAIVDNSTWNIYNFRLSLIRHLKSEGYRITVIAPIDEYIHYLNESFDIQHLPLHHLFPQRKNPLRDLLLIWELFRLYRRERPDLILHYTIKPNIFGNFAAWLAGVPSISTITGLGYTFLHKGLLHRFIPYLYRLAFRRVNQVVFYNADDRSLFLKRNLIPADKGIVIPGSGVNTNHFRPLPLPESNRFVFLFIGRLLYDKGLREYVEAARRIRSVAPQIECWIIGELNPQNPSNVSKEEMLAWIEAQHIQYFGVVKDVRHYIKRANVIVLPSYREGVPRSVLEGMSMSKPIITTTAAGCRDTVEHGRNGYLVPPRDREALADAMLTLYQLSKEEQNAMGQQSREKVLEVFDEKLVSYCYSQLIAQLEGRQKTAARELETTTAS